MEPATQHTGDLIHLLTQLLLFFGISGLVVPLLQRAKITPVLGYLLCGLAVGPYGLGLWVSHYDWLHLVTITDTGNVHLLGELGVIAMLFMIGLELSFQRLRELKHYVLGLGSLQIIVSAAAISAVAYAFHNGPAASLLLGASLALSSTAIVMQLLSEQQLGNRSIGTLCFSILLMQDLAVVPIVVLASAFAANSDQGIAFLILESLMIAAIAVAAIYLFGRIALRPLLHMLRFTQSPEWLAAFALFLVVGSACVTQSAGLSAALGAFLAGILLAETECSHAIEAIINPLKGLLLGIFFLSIGMMIDLREIYSEPLWIITSVIGIFTLKAVLLYPLCRFFRVPKGRSAKAAIMLSQPGEFAFLILSAALASGLMPREDGQFFLLVTAMAMFVTPLLFKLAVPLSRWIDKSEITPETMSAESLKNGLVLIAGFGRVGMQLANILDRQGVAYQALESDIDLVRRRRKEGYHVVYGDARHESLWRRIGVEYARAVIITADDPKASERMLATMQHEWPLLPVIMRARDAADMQRLYAMGAKYVIPEVEESSRQLAQSLLQELGMEAEQVFDLLQRERRDEEVTPA